MFVILEKMTSVKTRKSENSPDVRAFKEASRKSRTILAIFVEAAVNEDTVTEQHL